MRTAPCRVVDVDEPGTWPPEVAAIVTRWDAQVPNCEFAADLAVPPEAEAEQVGALHGHRLRAYHCTRLLPHEREQVGREGLRGFSDELFNRKIDRAAEHGYLDARLHARLRQGHLAAAEPWRARARWDAVHLSLGGAVLDDLGAVELLLGCWGGEGIYFSEIGLEEKRALQTLGTPIVVVCAVEIDEARLPRAFPALPKVLLGARRGLRVTADLVLDRPVAPDEIERLAGPGDEVYEAHPTLTRG